MPSFAVIGAQWGDEGKGKVVDLMAEQADLVARFSGGDNAGHTVINDMGEFALHLIPSSIFSKTSVSIIGNGTVLNPAVLLDEIDMLEKRDVEIPEGRLLISDRAHVIMPYHVMLDELEEIKRGGNAIGTTKKGIGPAYTDKVGRYGIRIGDLYDKETFIEKLRVNIENKNLLITKIYEAEPMSFDEVYEKYTNYAEKLNKYVCDTSVVLEKALKENKVVMLEGAQGTMLDTDFGTYPFATSSSPLASGACLGSGISPRSLDKVLGIFKAYCTRVGGGPFPTELHDEIGNTIRDRAHEYGTTTGRPRRIGWFDAVAARLSQRVNGFTGIAITRFDILDILDSIKICTSYKIGDKIVNDFPATMTKLGQCQPIYEEMPGWKTDTSNIRSFDDLPPAAKAYVHRLEELIGAEANLICVGPERTQTIVKKPVLS